MTDIGSSTPWQCTSSRPVYENPWFRVREDQVIRPDGSPGVLVTASWVSLGRIRYSAVTNVGHLFLARDLAQRDRPRSNDDWTELIWLEYPAAISLVLAGKIMESTSLAALMKAEALRQRGDWSLPGQ
jgi:hypothetical protein